MSRSSHIAVVLAVLGCLAGTDASAATAVAPPHARAPARQLDHVESTRAFGVTFRRYRQVVEGLPVLGAEAVVADAPGTSKDLLVDATRRGVSPPADATITRVQAIAQARAATGAGALRTEPRATLAILPRAGASQPVWQVLLAPARPFGSYEVLVDARSKAVLRVRDLLRRETGRAAVFMPNPVTANGGRGTLADNNDADTPDLTGLRREITLERLTGGQDCLTGQWVVATNVDAAVCMPSRDFSSLTRSDNRFEAAMAYYHVDRAQAYIQSLGFTNVNNRQTPVRTNVTLPPQDPGGPDNSFYDPLTGEIILSNGNVDDGEDGDIIDHEYGHAVQNDQIPGFGGDGQTGAMGEGFADYLAAALDAQRAPDPTFNPCIGEWDQLGVGDTATVPCIRRTDRDRSLTAAAVGPGTICDAEVHCAGEAWSSALWEIRARLGGAITDRLVIQSHFSLTPNASFQDGSRALLFADRTLYGGANRAFLGEVLSARGLLDLEHADDTPAEAIPLAVPGTASGRLGNGDLHDLYSIGIERGRGVVVTLTGGPGNLDVRLLAPGAASTFDRVVAGSTGPTAAESLAYVAGETGTHFIDVASAADSGDYTVTVVADRDGDAVADGADNCPDAANAGQPDRDGDKVGDACDRFPADAANDADGDGIGADRDNCPMARNATQADWDRDRRGDACDSSTRARILRVTQRRGRVTVRASVRPTLLAPSTLRVRVAARRVCNNGRCRERLVRTIRATRGARAGEPKAVFRLRPGRYVLRAVVQAPRYARATSPRVTVRVRGA